MNQADRLFRVIYREVLWQDITDPSINLLTADNSLKNSANRSRVAEEYIKLYPNNYSKQEVELIINNQLESLEGRTNPLYLYLKYAQKLLTKKQGRYYVIYENLFEWQGFTSKVDEIIFLAAINAQQGTVNIHDEVHKIHHDNKQLYHVLNKGIYENHMHLKASGNTWEMNWNNFVSIDKRSKILKTLEKDHVIKHFQLDENLYYKIATIRAYLQLTLLIDKKIVQPNQLEGLEEMLNYKYPHQYQERQSTINSINLCAQNTLNITSELEFLKQLFQLLLSDKLSETDKNIFNYYLAARSVIKFKFAQDNIGEGFDKFKNCEEVKEVFLDDSQQGELIESVLYNYYQEKCVKGIEVRIAPKDKIGLLKTLNLLEAKNNQVYQEITKKYEYKNVSKIKLGVIIHFIKVKEESIEGSSRNYHTRMRLKDQLEELTRYFESDKVNSEHRSIKIIGIDAANHEIGCPPEVLAPIYRKSREEIATQYKLGFTYHVGEEFMSLSTGLRCIDEVIEFMNFTKGDRLGHAIALGISVDQYLERKRNRIITHLQSHIDDLAWLYDTLRVVDTHIDKYHRWLEEEYMYYIRQLYKGVEGEIPNIQDYISAYHLRGDVPESYLYKQSGYLHPHDKIYFYNHKNKNRNKSYENKRIHKIYVDYHYNVKLNKNGKKTLDINADPIYSEIVKETQKILHDKIYHLGVTIEANPTSNVKIGAMNSYQELPMLVFNTFKLKRENGKENIPVTINTDDSAIFSTSISLEYSYVALALIKDGEATEDVMEYMDYIRDNSIVTTFIDNS